jgi:8-oxo-dGTP pyrophosphatase MutT (NUDIX family)
LKWLDEISARLAARPAQGLPLDEGMTPSAVLVPLFVAEGELWLLVIRRSPELPHHAGQYAFPGGVREGDDEDDVATALRESREEIGIAAASVIVLGRLNDVRTPTGYRITPVVGAIPYPLKFEPQPAEVEAILPVPLAQLANDAASDPQEAIAKDSMISSPVYHYRGHLVSGATARIIADLLSRLEVPAAP